MSSFKNFAPTLRSLQAQADGTGTIAGSPLEDFLSIAGYETPGGGGGGSSDFSTATVTFNLTLPEGTTFDGLGGRIGFEFVYGIEYESAVSTADTTLPIVLYNGEGYISNFFAETTDGDYLVLDGDPTLSDTITWDGSKFTVTGDGTVTATMVVDGGGD